MRRPHQRVKAAPWIESLSLSRFRRDAAMGRSRSHRRQHHSDWSLSRDAKGVRLDLALGPQRRSVGGNRICKQTSMDVRASLPYSEVAILRRKVANVAALDPDCAARAVLQLLCAVPVTLTTLTGASERGGASSGRRFQQTGASFP